MAEPQGQVIDQGAFGSPAFQKLRRMIMMYAEASYFDGYAFAHIAVYEEELRLRRIRRSCAQAVERERRARPRALRLFLVSSQR